MSLVIYGGFDFAQPAIALLYDYFAQPAIALLYDYFALRSAQSDLATSARSRIDVDLEKIDLLHKFLKTS